MKCLLLQGHFLKSILGGKIFMKSSTFVFWVDFLGKKIYDKLFGLYRQKNPGTGGGGGSGPGMGEYLGAYAWV